jgi:iron complex transport system substrate-binding protein
VTASRWLDARSRSRRRHHTAVSLTLLLAIVAVAWSAPPAVGRLSSAAATPPAAATPRRIVTLVPSITELLFAIGAGSQVVGVSSYDHDPPAVEHLPRLGALVDPDVERLLALRPDLVVIYGSQAELAEQLRRASIRTYPYAHGDMPALFATIADLGRVTGHETEARALGARLQAQLDTVRARVAGRPKPRVLLVFGREPLSLRGIYASGGIGFLHDLVGLAGGENVFADVRRESVQATAELVLARHPDVIVEIRADPIEPELAAREVAAWSSLPALPAVRHHRVVLLTGSELVTPGPRIGVAAERMERAIQEAVMKNEK